MMTFAPAWLPAVIVTAILCIPLPAAGDVGPLQMFKGGGVVAPKSPHPSIRLDTQEVIIRLKNSSYVVDVVFNLFNTAETTTEWIGFPKWVASRVNSYPTFMRFAASVNGEQIEFNEAWDLSGGEELRRSLSTMEFVHLASEPMKEKRQWLVSRATFPGHAKTTIRVVYEAPYNQGSGFRETSYIYGTGSLWKGNIKRAAFIVDSMEVGGTEKILTYFEKPVGSLTAPVSEKVESGPGSILTSAVRYDIKNFEPHPEAYFRIRLSGYMRFIPKANYVRPKSEYPKPLTPPDVSVLRKNNVSGSVEFGGTSPNSR